MSALRDSASWLFWQLSIDHNMDVHQDVHYKILVTTIYNSKTALILELYHKKVLKF